MPGFNTPTQPQSSLVDLDPDVAYIGKLVEIEERASTQPPRYNAAGQQLPNTAMVWKMTLTDPETGEMVLRDDGTPYQQWAWGNASTFLDPTGAKTANSRKYMHAFAGRVLDDDEVIDLITADESGLPKQLIGRTALVDLETRIDPATKAVVGYKVANLRVHRKPKVKAQPKPEPEVEVEDSAMGAQARKQRTTRPTVTTEDVADNSELTDVPF